MSSQLLAVAAADFRDRSRQPAFLVTVVGAIALGFIAIPPVSASYAMVKVGAFRGVYDSAYIGMLLAMIGSLWLPLFGFYVIRSSISRDISTGVGTILSATPLRMPNYLLGKFLSNLMVLGAMAAALAFIGPVMQLLRGEATGIDLVALWLPLVLFCLPMLALAAAAGVVVETTPFLRGGAGNILWFITYPALFLASIPALYGAVTAGFQADLVAQHPGVNDEISIGLTAEEGPLGQFMWSGSGVTASTLGVAAVVLVASLALAVLPGLWFGRFDPARQHGATGPAASTPSGTRSGAGTGADTGTGTAKTPAFTQSPQVLTPPQRGFALPGLLVGTIRIHLGRLTRWWWILVALATVSAFVVPQSLIGMALLFAWLLPVLAWSNLGTLATSHNVNQLVDCGSSRRLRTIAEWAAGVLIAAVAGAGPLVRMLISSDLPGIAAWVAGATAIPALALLLGSISRNARVFQAVYLALWYAVLNGVTSLDIVGATRTDGALAGLSPALSLGISATLIAATMFIQEVRHAHR